MGEKYVSREPDTGWTAMPTRQIPLSNTKDASITDAPDVFPRTEKRQNTLWRNNPWANSTP